ncbi:hypothetical protein DL93DRAFT_2100284 [Clavulina sp. PMI_390]|nr:hypothetical protein DL93DRAFT_2100284 [Clavulina sp. PMI_390]
MSSDGKPRPKPRRDSRQVVSYATFLRFLTAAHSDIIICGRPQNLLQINYEYSKKRFELIDELLTLVLLDHADAKFKMASSHNALQPIMKIPPEILSSIFLVASSRLDDPALTIAPEGEYTRRGLLPDGILPSQSFLSLNLMCKKAREASLASPRCWKDVHVVIKDGQVITQPSVLRDRLHRSKNVPFHLFFYITDSHHAEQPRMSVEIKNANSLDVLTQHVHRCQKIAFFSPYSNHNNYDNIKPVLRYIPGHYSTLQHLILSDYKGGEGGNLQGRLPYSYDLSQFWPNNLPSNVTCVELLFSGVDTRLISMINSIAPPGVRFLRLGEALDPYNVIKCLRNTPLLEHLDWSTDELFRSGAEDNGLGGLGMTLPTVLPHLISLRLRSCAPHPGFFKLVAPRCRDLYLAEREPWDTSAEIMAEQPYWDALTLPRLKRLSIRRPPYWPIDEFPRENLSDDPGPPVDGFLETILGEDNTLWRAVRDFFTRHSELEELLVLSGMGDQFTWHWFFTYLSGQPWHGQAVDLMQVDDDMTPTGANATVRQPLPKLRVLCFEIYPREWRTSLTHLIIASIREMLIARPNVLVRVCVFCDSPLEEYPLPEGLEALAADFSPNPGEVTRSGGQLELLPVYDAHEEPEAWDLIRPSTCQLE